MTAHLDQRQPLQRRRSLTKVAAAILNSGQVDIAESARLDFAALWSRPTQQSPSEFRPF
jgi:hypothetical protein